MRLAVTGRCKILSELRCTKLRLSGKLTIISGRQLKT